MCVSHAKLRAKVHFFSDLRKYFKQKNTPFVRKKCHFIAYFGEFPQIYAIKSF